MGQLFANGLSVRSMKVDRELAKILETNPWKGVADKWFSTPNPCSEFVLPSDERVLSKTRGRYKLAIPPQPFVGHPSAPIWIMLKNPGLGYWDRCDMLEGKKGLSVKNREFATAAADDCLELRQKLYCDQLKFKCNRGNAFILLSEAFNAALRGGRNPRNAYLWYHKYLLSRNGMFDGLVDISDASDCYRFMSRNVFVLDYVPYHSKNFIDFDEELAHIKFWKKLVRYALDDGKKLLVFWGSKILVKLQENKDLSVYLEHAVNDGRIAVIKKQQVYFSPKTTYLLTGKSLVSKVIKRRGTL